MNEVYEARRGAIVEIKDNTEFRLKCGSCGLVPDILYWCHFKDVDGRKRIYFQYECFECCEKIFKREGYYNQYVDLLYIRSVETFPHLLDENNLLFISDGSYCGIVPELTLANKLLYG